MVNTPPPPPKNHRSPNDWFYAGMPGCFAALPQPSGTPVSQGRGLPELTPSGTAAERLTQLLARSETFLKAVHTYHSLLVADMSHEEVKEGSSLFACLTNAITSSNLPFKPLVWAPTSPFKAKRTRLAHRLNSRTQYDWKEIGISYKFKLDGRSKGVETSREKWQWVAGTVLQMSLVNITAGQRILLCVHSNVYIWLYC